MAAPILYASTAELKAVMGIATDKRDVRLSRVLESASRHIENETGRQFYESAEETRYFTVDGYGGDLVIDDALTITDVEFDLAGTRLWDTALLTTDYWPLPDGGPYTRLQLDGRTNRYFPTYRNGVKVTGTWGYNETGQHPAPIREATLLYALRLYKRPAAPFGAIENSMGGPPLKVGEDADIAALLAPYTKSPDWLFV